MPALFTVQCVCDESGCNTSVERQVASNNVHPELVIDAVKDSLPSSWRVELDEETGKSTWFCPTHA